MPDSSSPQLQKYQKQRSQLALDLDAIADTAKGLAGQVKDFPIPHSGWPSRTGWIVAGFLAAYLIFMHSSHMGDLTRLKMVEVVVASLRVEQEALLESTVIPERRKWIKPLWRIGTSN